MHPRQIAAHLTGSIDVSFDKLLREYRTAKSGRVDFAGFSESCRDSGYDLSFAEFLALLDDDRNYLYIDQGNGFYQAFLAEGYVESQLPPRDEGDEIEGINCEPSTGAWTMPGIPPTEAGEYLLGDEPDEELDTPLPGFKKPLPKRSVPPQ